MRNKFEHEFRTNRTIVKQMWNVVFLCSTRKWPFRKVHFVWNSVVISFVPSAFLFDVFVAFVRDVQTEASRFKVVNLFSFCVPFVVSYHNSNTCGKTFPNSNHNIDNKISVRCGVVCVAWWMYTGEHFVVTMTVRLLRFFYYELPHPCDATINFSFGRTRSFDLSNQTRTSQMWNKIKNGCEISRNPLWIGQIIIRVNSYAFIFFPPFSSPFIFVIQNFAAPSISTIIEANTSFF